MRRVKMAALRVPACLQPRSDMKTTRRGGRARAARDPGAAVFTRAGLGRFSTGIKFRERGWMLSTITRTCENASASLSNLPMGRHRGSQRIRAVAEKHRAADHTMLFRSVMHIH